MKIEDRMVETETTLEYLDKILELCEEEINEEEKEAEKPVMGYISIAVDDLREVIDKCKYMEERAESLELQLEMLREDHAISAGSYANLCEDLKQLVYNSPTTTDGDPLIYGSEIEDIINGGY